MPDQISQAIWLTQGCAMGSYNQLALVPKHLLQARPYYENAGPDVRQDLDFPKAKMQQPEDVESTLLDNLRMKIDSPLSLVVQTPSPA